MAQPPESGLWKRGFLLLVLMSILAAVVLYAIFQRAEPTAPEPDRPWPLVLVVGAPAADLPGTFSWGALLRLSELLPSSPGWDTRYNATLALARRGSDAVRLDILAEMLDENRQFRNFRTRLKDGREVADVAAAQQTILGALKAAREWHQHPKAVKAVGVTNHQLQMLYVAIDRLTQHPSPVLSSEAKNTQLALK
jgi:hypothetical protein